MSYKVPTLTWSLHPQGAFRPPSNSQQDRLLQNEETSDTNASSSHPRQLRLKAGHQATDTTGELQPGQHPMLKNSESSILSAQHRLPTSRQKLASLLFCQEQCQQFLTPSTALCTLTGSHTRVFLYPYTMHPMVMGTQSTPWLT